MNRWRNRFCGRISALGLFVVLSATLAVPQQLRAAEHTIEILDFALKPDRVMVAPGDKVTWVNRDIAPHTATANDETWDTKQLKIGEAMSITVTKEMKLEYFCRFHPHMKATLVLTSDQN